MLLPFAKGNTAVLCSVILVLSLRYMTVRPNSDATWGAGDAGFMVGLADTKWSMKMSQLWVWWTCLFAIDCRVIAGNNLIQKLNMCCLICDKGMFEEMLWTCFEFWVCCVEACWASPDGPYRWEDDRNASRTYYERICSVSSICVQRQVHAVSWMVSCGYYELAWNN